MSHTEFEEQLLSLPEPERVHLIEVLWQSLLTDDTRQRADAWQVEAERRLEAVETGELPLLDAAQVFRTLRGD